MNIAEIDHIAPAGPFAALPLRIEQRSGRLSSVALLALLVPVTLGVVGVGAALAEAALTDPAVQEILAERPLGGGLAAAGLLFGFGLFGWPLLQRLKSLARRQTVEIADGRVSVTETGIGRQRHWSAALGEFQGLAHHVRTQVGGARHELVLVHADSQRTLLLAVADRFTKSDVEAATLLLGVGEVPARSLYGRAPERSNAPAAVTIGEPLRQAA